MTQRSRYIIGFASLALLIMYVVPIWKITLDAPQYPEGLGLEIWINDITGQKEHDLANVNNLNHYIGMKRIEPDSIPELVIMPWIIGGVILLGLLTAATGRRWLLYTWVILFIGIAAVGLYDFYLWEYDYGHNRDQEKAIIKIPGMTYQPPLIGSKQLLNFTAYSWPALGGIVAFLVMGVGIYVAFIERSKPKPRPQMQGSPILKTTATSLALFLIVSGCNPTPRPLEAGVDRCTHCLMSVSDMRYGAEAVLTTGKVLPFDSVECLVSYLEESSEDIHSLWVVDFTHPGTLIPVSDALFLHSEALKSPMGLNLTAYMPSSDLDRMYEGDVLEWNEVVDLVRSKGLHAGVH